MTRVCEEGMLGLCLLFTDYATLAIGFPHLYKGSENS